MTCVEIKQNEDKIYACKENMILIEASENDMILISQEFAFTIKFNSFTIIFQQFDGLGRVGWWLEAVHTLKIGKLTVQTSGGT